MNTTVIHNTYINRTTVINNTTVNRVSYNGGTGGINARPTPEEQAAEHEQHIPASSVQMQHEQAARTDHTMLASVNHGQPAVAATAKPGVFRGEGVVAARAAGPNQNHPVPRPPNANRPSENVASNHATQNGGVPRPPNNNLGNSANNRANNNHANYDRPGGDPANNSRPNNNPGNTAHANAASHPSVPRPSQPSHPPKSEHQDKPHPEERKDR